MPPWVIVKAADILPNGDTGYEVAGKDIASYFNTPFWLTVRYWMNYKKFGLPHNNWLKLTLQQIAVINLFDQLDTQRKGK